MISPVIVVLCAACSGGSSYSTSSHTGSPTSASVVPTVTFARTTLRISDASDARAIDVEVAANGEQSERGLGYRDTLAADGGMIFDLHGSRIPSFWMKGMRFALDMVWIGEDKRVAGITANVAPQPGAADAQLRRYAPIAPVRYVLELNSGAAGSLGVVAGVQLSFTLP